MFGIYIYGSIPFSLLSGEGGDFNFRHLILRALKQNLEAITIANGFRAEIKGVVFGGAESQIRDGEILIYGIRDAVINYQSEAADQTTRFTRPSSRTRNIYVKLRLLIKSELCGEITDDMLELRENYADSIIKGLYGRHASARQLNSLLLDGIACGSGLVAFDISQFKEYGFSGRLELEAEVRLMYKEKFY
ncbi:MAG TPA: hypothetical protein VHO43_14515 [Ignavibacteriales bacterium]|nr:hypothetical protein [Ignavibacteriales bacterium]